MSANSGRLFNKIACEADEQRSPLGYTRSGRPVWPIFGAEPDDDDDDDSDDDDDDDESGSAADKSKDKGAKGKDADDDDDDELEAERRRAERYRARMKAADRRATEAERERDALKNKKDGDGEDGSAAVVAEKDKQIESLSAVNRDLRLQNAFLLDNTYQWHDPADVMGLVLKDEDVEIDDDGEVTGVKDALKRIARKKPWLIKEADKASDDDDDEDDDEDDTDEPAAQRRTSKATASAAAGRRKRKGEADREALLRTYPALASRR
jgi:hypothetical protein